MDPNSFDYNELQRQMENYKNLQGTMPDQAAAAAIGTAGGIFAGAMMVIWFFVMIAIYVVMALSLYKIALKTKTNVEHAWFAWVPILNIILMLNIAGFSGWYIFVLMIPFVNIVFAIYVWMKISKACGKPDYLGLLMLVPLANILLPLYLAYGEVLEKK